MKNKKGYVDSYVAFIDILGFKEFIKNNEFKNVNELFSNIKNSQDRALSCFNLSEYKGIQIVGEPSNMTINVISDSIVISIPKTAPNSLDYLLTVSSDFAFEILRDYNLLCRGAIAQGDFCAEENIVYGPALVEAYVMESKLAVYPRIIFTKNTLESYLNNRLETDDFKDLDRKILIGLDIKDDLFYVDYLKNNMYDISEYVHKNPSHSNRAYLIFNSIRNNIENKISNETNPHIREKYLYLKRYYNQAILDVQEILSYPIPFKCDYIFGENCPQNNTVCIDKSKSQNYSNNNIINSSNTTFGENISVKINNSESEMEKEICSILSSLSLKDRSELLTIIYKFADEHKK